MGCPSIFLFKDVLDSDPLFFGHSLHCFVVSECLVSVDLTIRDDLLDIGLVTLQALKSGVARSA
jgi:hypothetical protein